ncbi:MAG: hypothetical protein HKN92_12360 [Chitinophagales bacterium]|nr:hypothetical protein [Chitinophagales bacterium]
MKQWVLILFLGLSINSFSTDLSSKLKIYSGTEIGWWLFNQGSFDDAHLGYGRTDLKFIIPAGMEFHLEKNQFSAGLGISATWLFDDEMEFSNYRNFSSRDIRIGRRSVHSLNFYGLFAYEVLETGRFSLSPQVKLGSFKFYSDFIDSDQMIGKMFTEIGINFRHKIKRISLEVSPLVQILSASGEAKNSHHSIYGFGIQYGILWEVF